jgi:hypothetical protein
MSPGQGNHASVAGSCATPLHYKLEQVSRGDLLRKLKQRFGGKIIRDIRFRVG